MAAVCPVTILNDNRNRIEFNQWNASADQMHNENFYYSSHHSTEFISNRNCIRPSTAYECIRVRIVQHYYCQIYSIEQFNLHSSNGFIFRSHSNNENNTWIWMRRIHCFENWFTTMWKTPHTFGPMWFLPRRNNRCTTTHCRIVSSQFVTQIFPVICFLIGMRPIVPWHRRVSFEVKSGKDAMTFHQQT